MMYTLDEDVFDAYTAESCYWLGFIYGDGSISDRALRFELSNKDKNHLEKIKRFLGSDAPIRPSRKDCSKIDFCRTRFRDKLVALGIVPNKTYRENIPYIPKEYYIHFIRGILDSDGWVVKHKLKKTGPQYEFGFSSNNRQLLEDIQHYFAGKLGKSSVGYLSETKTCHQLIIGGNLQFQKLYHLIYGDSLESTRLCRKYWIAKDAMQYLENKEDGRTTRFKK